MKIKRIELRITILSVITGLLLSLALPALPREAEGEKVTLAELKLKVFEGIREGKVEPVKIVTSSFLRYRLSASIKSENSSEKEENQLCRVFNLKGVQLLTEANLGWSETGSKDFHMFRLDSKEYAIMVTLIRIASSNRLTCRVEVMEQDGDRKSNLLDSELSLDKNVITTFGFEDRDGRPYFLSIKVQSIGASAVTEKKGVLRPVTERVAGEAASAREVEPVLLKDAVKATGKIQPPKLIKKVDPVYPEEARQAGVEGIVILEVATDRSGQVAAVKVLRSVPLLDQAAIEAVKQWVYEPAIIDGQPRPIVFTVTVNFRLK